MNKSLLNQFACLALLLVASALPSALEAGSIPSRPEKLSFPPLKYEPPNPADYRVQLQSGPVAYILPDRELPLVNIAVLIRTGQYLESAGKEGIAALTGWLLTHGGAGTNTAEQLEERVAFLGAQFDSEIGDTRGSVRLNLLSKDLDEGLGLLRDVLSQPRFQDDKITLRKEQMLQEMKQRNDDSAAIEDRERGFLALGDDFWACHLSTAKSLEAIARDDIEQFHHHWFSASNFVIAASGDFDRDQLIAKLEKLFSAWPFNGEIPPPVPTNTTFATSGIYLVNKPEVNQGRVSMMLPGIRRDNPDIYAVTVMNDILGGGGFTSRIVNRVRSDEGLAYHAGSRFPGGIYYPFSFTALFQSKSRTVPYAIFIIQDELGKIANSPVTDEELRISRAAFIERFPRNFATKKQTAAIFADDEITGRYASEPDYWKNFRSNIETVGKQDIHRVAKKYLTADRLVILIVGNKADILLGHPDHDIKLGGLGGGKLTDLPLRDPLTMLQITAPVK